MTGKRVEVPARRIGRHAYEYFATCDRPGEVVGAFRSGYSLLINDKRASRIITLQTPDVPLHPWAIEVDALRRNFAHHDPLACRKNGLSIRHWNYTWDRPMIHRLEIGPFSEEETDCARSRLPILAEALESRQASRPASSLDHTIDKHLSAWRRTGSAEKLSPLAGLGTGSTPVGDDLLTGILAAWSALWVIAPQIRRESERLWTIVDAIALSKQTTQASTQMLQAAADGAFPEPLFNLAGMLGATETTDDAFSQALVRLLAQGATSGAFMLQGLLAGFEACDAAREQS